MENFKGVYSKKKKQKKKRKRSAFHIKLFNLDYQRRCRGATMAQCTVTFKWRRRVLCNSGTNDLGLAGSLEEQTTSALSVV